MSRCPRLWRCIFILLLSLAWHASLDAQTLPISEQKESTADFPPLQQWKAALAAPGASAWQSVYSANPPARWLTRDGTGDIASETSFWQKLKSSGATDWQIATVKGTDQENRHTAIFVVSFHLPTPQGQRTRYVLANQVWQQQGPAWKLLLAGHSDVMKMPQPTHLNPQLYRDDADAKADIRDALARAAREHKRVLLMFGANWCYDCHVLDYALHQGDLAPVLEKNFLLVHVDIGEGKANADVVSRYDVPVNKGVPAMVVLDGDGKVLHRQVQGEFQAARALDPDDVLAFLQKWKP
ncbi:MAG: thioredoxin family protein [Acidobacteria bacterium]|nr:thioredoxin family protein [Acidobacteriota bacterium]